MTQRLIKSPDVDKESLDDEVILLHRRTLDVRLLNETGAVLWDALDEFNTEPALVDLLAEARPELTREECARHVHEFLAGLFEVNFLTLA